MSLRRVIHQEITVMYTNSKEGLEVNEKNIYRIEEKQTTIIMEDFVMPYLMMNRKTDQRGKDNLEHYCMSTRPNQCKPSTVPTESRIHTLSKGTRTLLQDRPSK